MITIRGEARRKGLRMAAHVAALSGVLAAAAAAAGQARAADGSDAARGGAGAEDGTTARDAQQIADLLRVSSRGGTCGCSPCWGPPAPPVMREDQLARMADALAMDGAVALAMGCGDVLSIDDRDARVASSAEVAS